MRKLVNFNMGTLLLINFLVMAAITLVRIGYRIAENGY